MAIGTQRIDRSEQNCLVLSQNSVSEMVADLQVYHVGWHQEQIAKTKSNQRMLRTRLSVYLIELSSHLHG